ncbi:MAG: class IV adenylate cyclase [Flavisolibacter sp.]
MKVSRLTPPAFAKASAGKARLTIHHSPFYIFASTMAHLNYEFKAKCEDLSFIEDILLQKNPEFAGTDHQVDTYFNVPNGRLKLREGRIENALIQYNRADIAGAKTSQVVLYQARPGSALKQALVNALGIKVVVDKKRKIYFIDNVKFHLDEVENLGTFVEVEAIDADGNLGLEKLKMQCNGYAQLFQINQKQFMAESYSDMLMAKKSSTL